MRVYAVLLSGIGCFIASHAWAQIDVERDIVLDPAAKRSTAEEGGGYLSEDNILIVEIAINRQGTGDNIEIFQHEAGFFLPLGYLSRILEFPIKVDVSSGEASGWFIRENRIFDLNLARNEVIIEGKTQKFDPAMAHTYFDDIYVDSSLFSSWFPIDVELNFSDLIVVLKPREKLPMQTRLERESARKRISGVVREQVFYQRVPTPYQAYSEPFIGVNLGYQYANNIQEVGGHNTPYSVRASGDLGYMNTDFFVAGGARDGVQGLRTTFSRKDYEGNMLGVMGAREIAVGDINGTALPMVSQSSSGRGVSVSNYELDRGSKFDSRDFIGDAIPGWDVELYRNGVLLDSQIVASSGRYEFIDVPVLFGNNSFRLVFYGPQGEVKEETENYVIDDSFAKPGQLSYQLSVDEKSKTLFGLEERNRNILHDNRLRSAASLAYGISEKTTLTGGVVTTPLDDGEQHQYLQAGVRQSFGGILASLNTAYDTQDDSSVLQMIAATSVNDISIKAEQQILDDFVSEVHSVTGQQRQSLSALDINGVWVKWLPSGVNYNFSGEYEKFQGDSNNLTTLSNRLSSTLGGLTLSNTLNWRLQRSAGNVNKLTTGDISLRGRWMETLIRPTLTYDVSPESALRTASISAQRNLSRTLNIRADIRKDLQGQKITTMTTSLTKDFESYRLGTNFQGNDDGDITIGMNLSFALGREPRRKDMQIDRRDFSSSGAVSARAFLDKNKNQRFDENDEVLTGVGFRVDNRLYEAEKGAQDVFMPFIPVDKPVNVNVEQSTVEDPFWITQPEGYSIVSRPGLTTQLDFPVVITTEIDGEIYVQKGVELRSAAGVVVELVDKLSDKVVKTTRSEFDGFYLFQKVVSGEYYLRIQRSDLDYYGAIEDQRIELRIPEGSDIVSNQNLTIVQSREELMQEDEPVQEATESELPLE